MSCDQKENTGIYAYHSPVCRTAGCSSRDIEEAADLFRETVQDTLNTGKENAEEDTKEIPEKRDHTGTVGLLLRIQYLR